MILMVVVWLCVVPAGKRRFRAATLVHRIGFGPRNRCARKHTRMNLNVTPYCEPTDGFVFRTIPTRAMFCTPALPPVPSS